VHAILIFATVLGLAASPTRAPSADEQRLYDDGLRAFQSGDARAAEKAWKAGYAVARDPAFLVHIGEAQEKAGAPAEAVDTYRRYLREAPDAADRADIERRLARLAAPAPAVTPAPSPAPEEPGEFGATPPTPSLAPPSPPGAAPRPAAPAGDTEHPSGPAQPEDSGWNRYNITAVASASVAVVLLGTAALFAAKAESDESDVNRLVQYRDPNTGAPLRYASVATQYQQATADGPHHDRDAKIALAASAVAAALSITFFVLDAKLGATPAIAIAPDGRGVAASGGLQWRF
jgi:hypothetical protein